MKIKTMYICNNPTQIMNKFCACLPKINKTATFSYFEADVLQMK